MFECKKKEDETIEELVKLWKSGGGTTEEEQAAADATTAEGGLPTLTLNSRTEPAAFDFDHKAFKPVKLVNPNPN